MEPFPEVAEDEAREPVGMALHPKDLQRLRTVARLARSPHLGTELPVLGTSEAVREGQALLVYDLERCAEELEAGGFPLTPLRSPE